MRSENIPISRRSAVGVAAAAASGMWIRTPMAFGSSPTLLEGKVTITPFRVAIPEAAVADLRRRIAQTRWPSQIPSSGWDYGANTRELAPLIKYWGTDYDWRARERYINSFPQFVATINGHRIHYLHIKAKTPGGRRAVPLLMLHGWPGSFLQMLPIVGLLTDSATHGAPTELDFDVIVPSLPGFGFSAIPNERGMSTAKIAPILHALMTEGLGYSTYALRSSDLGAGVATLIAAGHKESIIGSHSGGTNPYVQNVPSGLTAEEKVFVGKAQQWMQSEMAYAMEHASKPQTLAHALNDSPSGLAAWILEKFWRWGDTTIPIELRFGRDALLDNLSLYWFTETIGSSVRLYYETVRDPAAYARADVPTALLSSTLDMFPTPRSWAERQGRVDRWTEIAEGGHFLEWEKPEHVAHDLRAFFSSIVA